MDCRALSSAELPHASKLYRHYVEDFPKVQAFYSHPPNPHELASYAKQLRFPDERRRQVAGILRGQNESFGAGEVTRKHLARLEEGAVAVVTGQQVGLLGGPAYAFYKALTAIATARELTQNGIAAVPVFWMATEDHDLDEVRQTTWFTEGNLQRFALPGVPDNAQPVGQIRLGDAIDGIVREATASLSGPFGGQLAEIVRQSYTPEETYGSAFGKMFARIFSEEGLILLDPLDPNLHRIATVVLCQALAQRDILNDLLLQRGKDLNSAGYEVQVRVTSRSTLLFSLEGGRRQVISAANGGAFICAGKSAPRQEWLHRVDTAPEKFSPNALLRSVVQDYLLPTAAYLAGPAEIAYFAQSQVIYQTLLGRMPVIFPRADFTLVDPKGVRLLKKYKLEIADVWRGAQELRKAMYAKAIPKKLAREFERQLEKLEKSADKLHQAIAKVDPTLQGTITRAEKRIRYQLEKLRSKTGASLDRHEKQVQHHAEFLENLLYPHKGLQARDLCFLPFLARWGSDALEQLREHASVEKPGRHWVVPIP